MLSKLALKNAKRSIKDYVIYLITVTLAFSFIFAFNLISNSNEVASLANVMDNFKYVMYAVNIIIVFVVGFLINYTTKFMFQKRSKEFGTYLILGIEKKDISKMFILENLVLGFISFIFSIFLGFILSIFMTLIIMNIFEAPFKVMIEFNYLSILLSVLYFVIIYSIVLFFSQRRIKKMKIYDLLYFDKQNEKRKIRKSHRNVSFIISLIFLVVSLILFDQQFKAVGVEPSFAVILMCLILVIISIYGIIFTVADFILYFILKHKKIKYSKDNLFVVRNFSSKVKTMSFTLGTLTILITFTLICLNMSSMFKGMFDYQIDSLAPYDIIINDEEENFNQYLSIIKENYTVEEIFTYNSYMDSNNNVKRVLASDYLGWKDYDQVLRLSDYNKLLELKGMAPITLNDDEYLLHALKEYYKYEDNKQLQNITLSNGISLKQKDFVFDGYSSKWAIGLGYIIVVPDYAIKDLEVADNNLVVDTKEKTSEDFASKLVNIAEPDLCEDSGDGYQICYSLSNITVKGQEEANNNGIMTICSFVFYYVAIIFTTIVGTILAIQSLSDSTKYKYRYQVLNKLGVDEINISKTIRKQLLWFFIFPIFIPIIVSFCTITSMNRIFKIALSTNTAYLTYFFGSLLVFFVIYIIYFIATYFGFKKNIFED